MDQDLPLFVDDEGIAGGADLHVQHLFHHVVQHDVGTEHAGEAAAGSDRPDEGDDGLAGLRIHVRLGLRHLHLFFGLLVPGPFPVVPPGIGHPAVGRDEEAILVAGVNGGEAARLGKYLDQTGPIFSGLTGLPGEILGAGPDDRLLAEQPAIDATGVVLGQ